MRYVRENEIQSTSAWGGGRFDIFYDVDNFGNFLHFMDFENLDNFEIF